MDKRQISVLITDLDNTLYDWVEIWYQSFNAMFEHLLTAAQENGIARNQLIREIRSIHQKYGTSEYAFLIEELPCFQALFPGENLSSKFDAAIHSYRKARKSSLRLYDYVGETLDQIRERGTLIVAYTESMAFYTNYRLRNLELDERIDFLYSPEDHGLPLGLTPDQIRRYPPHHYELRHTIHRHTPKGELKPNPRILLDIIGNLGAEVSSCIFVGDSLMKDVSMAKDAGVTDVYALYGKAQNRTEYELLREVSHWPENDVHREKLVEQGHVEPSYVLKTSLRELLELFEFVPFSGVK